MKELLEKTKELIKDGKAEEAIALLESKIHSETQYQEEIYYQLGNAYRKLGNWQGALNNYQEAIDINPESPANEARKMIMDILNFYNKDMFNQ